MAERNVQECTGKALECADFGRLNSNVAHVRSRLNFCSTGYLGLPACLFICTSFDHLGIDPGGNAGKLRKRPGSPPPFTIKRNQISAEKHRIRYLRIKIRVNRLIRKRHSVSSGFSLRSSRSSICSPIIRARWNNGGLCLRSRIVSERERERQRRSGKGEDRFHSTDS